MRRSLLARGLVLGLLAALFIPSAAVAQDGPTIETVVDELNTTWVIVAAVLVMFMQAGFLFLELGFTRGKNVGTMVAKILVNFSVSSIVWWVCGFAIAFGGAAKFAGDSGFLLGFNDTISGGLVEGNADRQRRGVLLLPVRLLRRLAGDRLGLDARADQVHRLPDLRDRLLGADLPADRPLDLRRRHPVHRRQRRAGLRRLDRRPPHRRHRRARRGAAARPAQGQVRARRQATRDPRALHAAVRPRRADPVAGLVRLQPGLDAGHGRQPLRRGRGRHQPRRRGRRHRRRDDGLLQDAQARRGHVRQRRDRRARRHHGALGLRGVLGRPDHRPDRRHDRRRRRVRHRQGPRRPGRRAVRARPGRHLGHAGLRHLHLAAAGRVQRHRRRGPHLHAARSSSSACRRSASAWPS